MEKLVDITNSLAISTLAAIIDLHTHRISSHNGFGIQVELISFVEIKEQLL